MVFQHDSSNPKVLARVLFVIGCSLYFLANVGFAFFRVHTRASMVPLVMDDAYVYIVKAAEMRTCFTQHCPALEDLRSQLTAPSSDLNLSLVRKREYTRTFFIFHPLHSIFLGLLQRAGTSWEQAYEWIRVSGSVFFSLVIPYWLSSVWGLGPAGIALILLSFVIFPDQGLHHVVPSNLALGIAVFLWARISTRRLSEWALVLGTLALVAMHPVGRLYAIASVFLYAMLSQPGTRTKRVAVVSSTSLIVLSFVLPHIVKHPDLLIPENGSGYNSGWPETWYGFIAYGLYENFRRMFGIVRGWVYLYDTLAIFVVLTTLGVLTVSERRRSTVLWNGLIVFGLVAISFLHIEEDDASHLFHRVWIAMAILLTGATANIAWVLIAEAWSRLVALRRHVPSNATDAPSGFSALFARSTWALVGVVALGALIVTRFERGVAQGLTDLRAQKQVVNKRDLYEFDITQPNLVNDARSSDAVLYLDEVPMHFYFTYGALNHRAIYYPALVDPASVSYVIGLGDTPRVFRPVAVSSLSDASWLRSDNLRYLVAWNPITYVKASTAAMVPLRSLGYIEYTSPQAITLRDLNVNLLNRGSETTLLLNYPFGGGPGTARIRVPGHSAEWIRVPVEDPSILLQTFRLQVEEGDSDVFLKGLRFGESTLNWPWDKKATLIFHTENRPDETRDNRPHETSDVRPDETVEFDADKLLPVQGLNLSLRVLNDSGSTLLGEFVNYWKIAGAHDSRGGDSH